jgi:hypothetical protein
MLTDLQYSKNTVHKIMQYAAHQGTTLPKVQRMLICSSYGGCGGECEKGDWWYQSKGLHLAVKEAGWSVRRPIG